MGGAAGALCWAPRASRAISGRSSITTWLYSATTNLCLNRLRDSRTRARLLAEHAQSLPTSARSAASQHGPSRVEVRALIQLLPSELAEVAVLFHVDEMTHEEIASVLGCSRRQVGNLLARIQTLLPKETVP